MDQGERSTDVQVATGHLQADLQRLAPLALLHVQHPAPASNAAAHSLFSSLLQVPSSSLVDERSKPDIQLPDQSCHMSCCSSAFATPW